MNYPDDIEEQDAETKHVEALLREFGITDAPDDDPTIEFEAWD